NRHVRVDLLYEKFSPQDKGKVDFIGALIFLLPWCIQVMITGIHYLSEAWLNNEGSPNPGGIPSFVPVKALIPFSALLLFLQGASSAMKAYRAWQSADQEIHTS
ncbi:MAG: TRAP transporter small permease subunit, partial [Bacteroidota bacterium]